MSQKERRREAWSDPLSKEVIERKAAEGWRLVAVEWEREGEAADFTGLRGDVPFGLQVASDCAHLEENLAEKQAMVAMLELIVHDTPLSRVAEELNRLGHRTRVGAKWGPGAVFDLLPRLIEVGPQIFTSGEWADRRRKLLGAVQS